ncbi:hypothetical protein SU69_00040 [Thermosipho melanesiensis]|uniref:ABC transmembrane type-1 domain-containing protein n=1 Tax=Thermosipho melanesiensis TaxID=46541 RepID=A0ABM6GGR1_9BACT|nr:ABC transporter transmembrane domain-containing protein [Thermosipho melanesiensis]APT74789.1 hypothetical protein BW47_00040 [Thermosipho melanesiensis]OOC38491.1 hypothetical protein SU68_00040 [Thermosipho melanesiensis]OOC40295.1 hypothetical protein SU70_00040 [Thermosipho melanesiensis]OOC40559.1 hypothetical protein SU69_00040 [Thermosipho melanesiensis]OOC44406.1 hypothetical protein SU71_00040 [Thermosipho melanesiensis]
MGITVKIEGRKSKQSKLKEVLIKNNKKRFLSSYFVAFISVLLAVYLILLEKDMINSIVGKNYTDTVRIVYYILIFICLELIFEYLKKLLTGRTVERITTGLRNRLSEKLIFSEYSQVNKQKRGDVVSMVTNDLELIKEFLTQYIDLFYQLSIFCIALFFAAKMDFKMTLVTFVVIPIGFLIILMISLPIKIHTSIQQEMSGNANIIFSEAVNSMDVLKAYKKAYKIEGFFLEKFKKI